MNKTLRTLLIFSFLFIFSFAGMAQDRDYGTVYYSVKNGDTWGGLIKMPSARASLSVPHKGKETILSFSDGDNDYIFGCYFEAKTADGRAFHKVIEGGIAFPVAKWVSPSGNQEISWVYFNKDVYEIVSGDPKPFDVEIQFGDGSAIKYFISPSY